MISDEQYAAVAAILTDPRRRTKPAGSGVARTLLSGIAIWGPNGSPMYIAESQHIYRAKHGGQRLREDLDAYRVRTQMDSAAKATPLPRSPSSS